MKLSAKELVTATQAAHSLFEALNLETYQFEVEPEENHWLVRTECTVNEGWMTTDFRVKNDLLLQSQANPEVYTQLLLLWREELTACRRAKSDKEVFQVPLTDHSGSGNK